MEGLTATTQNNLPRSSPKAETEQSREAATQAHTSVYMHVLVQAAHTERLSELSVLV